MVFTIGFLIALALSVPFAFVDLDSSVSVTVGASCVSLLIALQWVVASCLNGLKPGKRMPAATSFDISYGQTMGTVMLNLGCATVIPSWINIKAMKVSTQSVMWVTIAGTSMFYIIIGVFFALGFDIGSSNNSLQALLSSADNSTFINEFSVAMYAVTMLLPGVPVNCIVSRDNLVQNKVVGKKMSVVLCYIVPLMICIPLQTRNYLFLFLTWTSLIFVSIANFIMPFMLYHKCVSFRNEFNLERSIRFDSPQA